VNQITKQGIIGPHCGATIQSVLPPQKYRLPPSLQSFDRAQENEGKLKQGQIFASQAAELPLAFTNIHYFFIQPIPLTATRSATPMIYNARRGTPPMTNIDLDSASRRQRGLLSTRNPSGQAATKFGLAVDQRGWPTLWRLKGYIPGAKCSRCPAVFCVSSLMIT